MKIGIIGLGDMGRLFARRWAAAGFEVYGCDVPSKTEQLRQELAPDGIHIMTDGVAVSRLCDFILYAVEAENIWSVVEKYGPATKYGAIVGGQTSVKSPEIAAFKKFLPTDTQIVTSHALYGPHADPARQTLAVINVSGSTEAFNTAVAVYQTIGSRIVEIESYEVHDKLMADIQAVTHVGFESIGTACMHRRAYPWAQSLSPNGLDNVKFLLTLRIYSYKPHVYEGLALLNPFARTDVREYARNQNELFGYMISGDEKKFRKKIEKARNFVFKDAPSALMLDDAIMREYSLAPSSEHKPNSHLSLLSMVCAWESLKTNPYNNLICQTPPFKLRVGMAEYLFQNEQLLEESIRTALEDKTIKKDDLAFHTAVHEWATIVEHGDKQSYRQHFIQTQKFLHEKLLEGREKSSLLISRIAQ